jgi:hypothetical protein
MQILSITDVKGNRSVSWSGQGGRSYSQQLRVITDDPTMGPRAVAKALSFKVGAQYSHPITSPATEWDYGNYLQGFDIKEEGDDGCQWLATLTFGPFNWVEQGGATTEAAGEGQTDPFKVPIKVSFGTAKYEREITLDMRGKPISNSLGEPFDPTMKRDDSRGLLTLVRNEPTFNAQYVQTFKDTCNQDTFLTIYKANTVKCSDVTAEREYQADWGYYWLVTYIFEIRESITLSDGTVIFDGWTELVLNKGLHEYRDIFTPSLGLKPVIMGGAPVTSPVPIGVTGSYDPDNTPYYRAFQIYPLQDFSKLNFPDDLLTVGSIPGQGGS